MNNKDKRKPASGQTNMSVNKRQAKRKQEGDPPICFVYTGRTKSADIPTRTIAHLLVDSSVKEIPDEAFKSCTKLMAVQLPETLNKIGDHAFEHCINLKSVQFYSKDSPSKLVAWPLRTWRAMDRLSSQRVPRLKIGSPNMTLGNHVFSKTGLVHVDLPQGLRVIGNGWFASCGSLVSAPIPSSVVEIGDSAFTSCDRLAEVNFSDGLKSIGSHSFDWCLAIQLCIIPSTVTTIGARAFDNCSSLKRVVLPCTLEIIEEGVFAACGMLGNVDLPNTLREIKHRSFSACRNLTHMRIPPFVDKFEVSAFEECKNMISLELPEGLESAHPMDGAGGERDALRILAKRKATFITGCPNLLNLVLPPHQEVHDLSKLREVVEGDDDLVFTLKHRFDDCPLHKLCYYHSYYPLAETMEKLKILLEADPLGATAQLDAFGMTPLHILLLTEKPEPSLLRALIDAGRKDDVIDAKDSFLQSPLDYLCWNRSPSSTLLLRELLSRTTVDRVQWLGLVRWRQEIALALDQTLAVDWSSRKEKVRSLFLKLETLERCENVALLEQALWETAIDRAGSAADRQDCLFRCGASVVIPNVLPFWGIRSKT
eukprot:scaffold328_cov130-Cylindrotheca_fusiformis.AAC.24